MGHPVTDADRKLLTAYREAFGFDGVTVLLSKETPEETHKREQQDGTRKQLAFLHWAQSALTEPILIKVKVSPRRYIVIKRSLTTLKRAGREGWAAFQDGEMVLDESTEDDADRFIGEHSVRIPDNLV